MAHESELNEAHLGGISFSQTFLGRCLRSRRLLWGFVFLLLVGSAALFPGAIAPRSPEAQSLRNRFRPPAMFERGDERHLLGTDQLGRDVLSRTLYASRISLTVGIASVLVAGLVGVTLGVLSGYFGGRIDTAIMRVADIQLAVPDLLLVVALVGVVGPSLRNVIIILAVSGWVVYARTARSLVLSLKERDYVRAARTLGASDGRIILRHIMPNIVIPLVVIATQQMAQMIIKESTLSFLGIGVPPHVPTWGGMIYDGRAFITFAWWMSVVPGFALLTTVLSVNFLGDGLRDVMDYRLRL